MKLYTAKRVAEWIGISEKRVKDLTRDGVLLPSAKAKGLYELQENVLRYIEYLTGKENSGEKRVDYNHEKALLMSAKRRDMEMEVRRREGQLHETEDVKMVMNNTFVSFKARLMAIPARVSPLLASKTDKTEIFEILRTECNEALMELSDFDNLFKKGGEDSETGDG